ncbi:MAG: alpha/beta hydrolase [Woeseiaceae bacterium]|nr:alpha/beta hydrolase [Woeseiaceae bacterium]
MSAKDHWIKTGSDGELDGTTPEEINKLVGRLASEEKIVIHLHGGLVSESRATAKAKELIPEYRSVDSYPVFFIYRTGVFEIIRNNLREIANEKIFKKLAKKLLKYAIGKLTTVGGAKAVGGLDMPRDLAVAIEYKKLEKNVEPYSDVAAIEGLKQLTDEEEKLFMDDLATDVDFQTEIQAIVDGATDDQEKVKTGAKGITLSHRVSSKTLMSPEVVQDLVEDASMKDGKGIFSTARAILKAGAILRRVVYRYWKKRDHGLHPTIVEELLREFYLANIGAAVWNTMKKETSDTFESAPGGEVRGGRYFVDKLGETLKDTGHTPEVTVVAHSLGSVFACNLIQDLAASRKDPNHPLPSTFQLKNLILLAPAVECEVFADTLRENRKLFEKFRMYSLDDEHESNYWEVPAVYSRSLLYLVSGAFEETDDEKSAFDRPLVGMQRYITEDDVYKMADVKKVRKFFAEDNDYTVWAVVDKGDGLASDAVRHGGFDDAVFKPGQQERRATLDSILHVIQHGM